MRKRAYRLEKQCRDLIFRKSQIFHTKTVRIKEFSKVVGHKISVAFPYPKDEQSEKKIQETISFTIASKRIKYFRINLTKEVKDL